VRVLLGLSTLDHHVLVDRNSRNFCTLRSTLTTIMHVRLIRATALLTLQVPVLPGHGVKGAGQRGVRVPRALHDTRVIFVLSVCCWC
jgi:hypothetical protein